MYPLKHLLKSGDQVEINTSSHQTPKQDWLNFVVTAKDTHKNPSAPEGRGRQAGGYSPGDFVAADENRKIEVDDAHLMQLIKKLKYRTVTDFMGISQRRNWM